MLWLISALGAAVLDTFRNIISKFCLKDFDEYIVAWYSMAFALIVLVPAVVFTGIPELGGSFVKALLITGSFNVVTTVLVMKAIKESDVSLVAPILNFSPVFLLLTAPFILGELPGPYGIIGVLLVVFGAFLLNIKEGQKFKLGDKGQGLALLATMIWAVSSNYYKIGMQNSSPVFFVACIYLFVTIALAPVAFRRYEGGKTKWLVLLGIVGGSSAILQWYAAYLTLVVYALSIKRLSTLFTVILAGILLKEKNTKYRIIGSVVMLAGVLLITI